MLGLSAVISLLFAIVCIIHFLDDIELPNMFSGLIAVLLIFFSFACVYKYGQEQLCNKMRAEPTVYLKYCAEENNVKSETN